MTVIDRCCLPSKSSWLASGVGLAALHEKCLEVPWSAGMVLPMVCMTTCTKETAWWNWDTARGVECTYSRSGIKAMIQQPRLVHHSTKQFPFLNSFTLPRSKVADSGQQTITHSHVNSTAPHPQCSSALTHADSVGDTIHFGDTDNWQSVLSPQREGGRPNPSTPSLATPLQQRCWCPWYARQVSSHCESMHHCILAKCPAFAYLFPCPAPTVEYVPPRTFYPPIIKIAWAATTEAINRFRAAPEAGFRMCSHSVTVSKL